jgi:exopolysaccharide biosynthesis polyprenyl glycosylphosphotransferase
MSITSTGCADEVTGENVGPLGLFVEYDYRHSEQRTQSAAVARGRLLGGANAVTAVIVMWDLCAVLAALVFAGGLGVVGLVYGGCVLAALATTGLHRARLTFRLADDAARIARALLLPFAVIMLLPVPSRPAPGLEILIATALIFVYLGRIAAYDLIRTLRTRRVLVERALIIGADEVGRNVARIMHEHPGYGLTPAGLFDAGPRDGRDGRDSGSAGDAAATVLRDPQALANTVRELGISRVIVAFSAIPDAELVRLLSGRAVGQVEVHVVPRLSELGVTPAGRDVDDLWGIPLVRARLPMSRQGMRRTKRVFDIVVGTALLLLTAPALAVAALAVRRSSPGPILFRQERLGEGGRPIRVLKFRTLRCNDDSDRTWCVDGDDRCTRVGRVLRSTGMDELPQIINVLRGDMSLIGPRPERPHFVGIFAREVPRYGDRHRLPQGITGWAQVHHLRGDTSISDRARFDNYYIENWTLWLDLSILIRTVGSVFGKRGS